MADGKVVIETDLDSSGVKSGLEKLKGIAESGIKGTLTAIGAVGTALAGLGVAAVKVGADFEAGMSEVQAISRASTDDMERLKDKAKEMGAKTKFSASESAEAFKYMAQAGWDTNAMLDGITGVMSLAAASGEELGLTSDIVTDSLTAFGLQAKDAARFSDVLAMTANATNTDVAKLGYTFKYVAPVAGALGYSIEDASVAIGLMANSGIKAEQAGTTLRAMLTNLAKPTDQVDMYMKRLSISMTDAQGNVKPLNQLLVEMRGSFSKLTDAQKAEYAAGIAGKEAMSGLLAIVNASDEDFTSLTNQINNCNGAAEEAAKIMQDNLKGGIEQLGGAVETLGLEFYESVDTPIKDIVITATDMVEQLTKAFKNGGLSSLVAEFGSVFATVVTKVAENAPKMIDAAVNMIQAFLQGIQDNSSKIADAAVKIGTALLNGLVTIIPKIAQVGVELIASLASSILGSDIGSSISSLGNNIINSFKSILQAVSAIINTLTPLISGIVTVIAKVADAVIGTLCKAVNFLADNIKIVIPLITGIATAFVAWKIIQTVTKSMQATNTAITAFNALNTIFAQQMMVSTGAISAQQLIVGVLTGKIKLATLAELAWNAVKLINPWVAIGVAVTAVIGGIVGLIAVMSKEDEEHKRLRESIEKETKARKEVHEEQQKTMKANLVEINRTGDLNTELKTLIDTNGKVKQGYEDRANYIMTEINKACGTEMTMVNGVMIGYGKLTDQLGAVIGQSKNWNNELKTLVDSNGKIKQGEEDRAKVLTEKLNESMKTNFQITGDTITNYGELSDAVDTQIAKSQALLTEFTSLIDENGKVKAGYEERAEFIRGELTNATGVEIDMNNGVVTSLQGIQSEIDKTIAKKKAKIISDSYNEVYEQALKTQKDSIALRDEAQKNYDVAYKNYNEAEARIKEKLRLGQQVTSQETTELDRMKKTVDEAGATLEKQVANVEKNHADISRIEGIRKAVASGNQEKIARVLALGVAEYDKNGKLIVRTVEENLQFEKESRDIYRKLMETATDEATRKELEEQIKSSDAKIAQLEQEMSAKKETITTGTAALLQSQIELVDANGEKFKTSFEQLMANAETGIKNGESPCDLAMQDNMAAIVTAITKSSMTVEEKTKYLADLQTKVFKDNINNVSDAEKSNMQAVLDSINSTNPNMANAVKSLVNTGICEIKDGKLEFSERAKQMGLDGSEELRKTKDDYNKASKSIIEGAGSGVINNAFSFVNSVSKMAEDAVSNFKEKLNINSPSKVFRDITKSIPEGARVGVEKNSRIAIDAVSDMAKDMIGAYDDQIDNFSTDELFDKLPEQEVKVVGILDKIKNLDASGLVQRIKAEVMSSQARAGMAFAARASTTNNSVTNNTTNQPIINFNQPVESPDTTARAVNRILTFGLAGDY